MLQRGSKVEILDNSGAKEGKCICVLDGFFNRRADSGSLVILSIRKLRLVRRVKIGQLFLGVIVKTKSWTRSKDNVFTKFQKNGAVLLTRKKQIFASKVFGSVSRNLRKKKYLRILLLAGLKFF